MNVATAQEALSREPFRPFNLYYPSGKVYAIRSRDQAMLTGDARTMLIPKVGGAGRGGFDILDVIMAERIEFLNVDPAEPMWWVDPGGDAGPDRWPPDA